jgi:hypothetical protein
MPTKMLFIIILVVEIFGILHFSRIYLRNYPKITSAEIRKLRPELGNVAFNYHPLTFIIFLVSIMLFLLVFTAIGGSGISIILILGSTFISLTLFEGILAMKTNIYPVTSRMKWDQFVYDESKSLRRIAKIQIGSAILGIVVNIFAWYIYRG